ncbi:cytochrome P450 [Clavulina sp. PMI_390]|nr:cytochrome P450 [Clavulina sp. PMI_390]
MSLSPTLAVILVFAMLLAFLVHIRDLNRRRNHPPGPQGYPVLGNVSHVPSRRPWLYFTALNAKFGDIVFLPGIKENTVVLGSYRVVQELFSKRAANYSERYLSTLIQAANPAASPPHTRYGPRWREERRFLHQYLGKEPVAKIYSSQIEQEAQAFVLQSVQSPHTHSSEYANVVTNTWMRVIYGISAESLGKDITRFCQQSIQRVSPCIIPGVHPSNTIPGYFTVSRWYQRFAQMISSAAAGEARWGPATRRLAMITRPYAESKKSYESGHNSESVAAQLFRDGSTSLDGEQLGAVLGSSHTTFGTVQFFIQALLLHPDKQTKAQAELDSVVGPGRLPCVGDISSLPYIEAMYKEVLRWRPVAPIAVPHEAVNEDNVDGYTIPKGAIVTSNLWAISRDDTTYPEPEKFLPERFLGQSPARDPRLFVFGIGRRICPGMALAETTVLAAMLTIIATANVVPALDHGTGDSIAIDTRTTGLFIDNPLPFICQFQSRSNVSLALLRDSLAE